MYTLELCYGNIRHRPWWRGGKILWEFNEIDELLSFIRQNIPSQDKNISFIRENDSKCERGSLCCNSLYQVRKGKRLMTDYTAF